MNDITTQIIDLPDLTEVKARWRALTQKANPSFFLTWDFIGTWVELVDVKPMFFVAQRDGQDIGLAFIGYQKKRRFLFPLHTAYLNQSGVKNEDSVYIEYNDILCEPQDRDVLYRDLLHELMQTGLHGCGRVDQLICAGMEYTPHQTLTEQAGQAVPSLQVTPQTHRVPYIDLTKVDQNTSGLLALLSANTRQQISRSLRLYDERGPRVIEHAETSETARIWLEELISLHVARFQAMKKTSGFENPFFCTFIAKLISCDTVDFLRISAGDHVIGYLINLTTSKTVLNYQAAFQFEEDNKLKPGLVAHVMAAENYGAKNQTTYSFLAGDSQYKNSLSTDVEELRWDRVDR